MFLEFLLIFFSALFFIWLIKKYASTLGLIDIPNQRSIHKIETPSGAGIGFFVAITLIVFLFNLDIVSQNMWTCIAILLVFSIGVFDDYYDTSSTIKFIIISISSILLSLDDVIINHIGVFFGSDVSFGWFAIPFTIFAIVGFTNALNLIDGLDGLAGTVSLIILSTFLLVGYQNHDHFIMLLSMVFIAGLLAFLLFNWSPASIFMGDSGSLTLGFIISILAIKSLVYLPAVSIFFITAIPLFDTIIVMTRRFINRRSICCPDRCHSHHVIRYFFQKDTKKTVLFMGLMQAIYSLIGLNLNRKLDEGYLLILFILNIILFYLSLEAMIKRQKREC